MSTFVTVKIFTCPHEAAIAQSMLDSEGIRAFLKDEHAIGSQPGFSNALGGVQLQVGLKDAKRAVELLLEKGYLTEADIQPAEEDEAFITIMVGKKYERLFKVLLLLLMVMIITGCLIFFSRRTP